MASQSPQRPAYLESDDAWHDLTLDMAALWLYRANDYALDLRDFWWRPEVPLYDETCCLCDREIRGHGDESNRRSQWVSESNADGSSDGGGHRFRAHPEVIVERELSSGRVKHTAVYAWICNGCFVAHRNELRRQQHETSRGFYEQQLTGMRRTGRRTGGESTPESVEAHDAERAQNDDAKQGVVTITHLLSESIDLVAALVAIEFRGRKAMADRLKKAHNDAAAANDDVRSIREAIEARDTSALGKLDPARDVLAKARQRLILCIAESKAALDEHGEAE